jgi:ubiquinone/menaquinone biosynthesis C-methylase UbiE
MSFADHFSTQSKDYAVHRPDYPDALFAWLAQLSRRRAMAWDCGCGNGQAAIHLARHFAQVLATDPSVRQLRHARPAPHLAYAAAQAEACPIASSRVDLVSVAQALHWFDLARFYAEVRRVLTPGGVVAAWCYGEVSVAPSVDDVIRHFYKNVVGPYWPPQRRHVEQGYRDLPFPFAEAIPPPFEMAHQWTADGLVAYIGTWSATQHYVTATGTDPLPALRQALAADWPDAAVRRVTWPLYLRVGCLD